jgi:uncharacterized protein DUF4382
MRAVAWMGAIAVLACNTVPGPTMSRVRLHLTDAPDPAIESAVVWISRAYMIPGEDGQPVVLTDEPQEYDLLQLQNGVTALLGDATVPAGRYAQLRLVVDSARLTLAAGVTFDDGSSTKSLKVPSGSASGIKVSFPGTLDLTEDAEVVVDFDVAENFVFQGPPAGPKSVLFTPHLRGSVQPSQP